MYYRLLKKTLSDFGTLIPADESALPHITDKNLDWYLSVYKFNEDQKVEFQQEGSIAGITDVIGECLIFDFDDEDLEKSRQDTVEVCKRLIAKGFDEQNILVSFSGGKGFHVQVFIDKTLTPTEHRAIAEALAGDLPTFDTKVYNATRILRVVGTKHQETGLYKCPIGFEGLIRCTIDEIKDYAKNINNTSLPLNLSTQILPDEVYALAKQTKLVLVNKDVDDIDFIKKEKGWTNCKWSLVNGNFKNGNRNESVTTIIATCRALNYPKLQAYYKAKGAVQGAFERFGTPKLDKEEIWNSVEGVYGPRWKGGAYTCKSGDYPWLKKICDELGPNKCKHDEKVFIELTDLSKNFTRFAIDIEHNKIKTGLDLLDKNVTICTSTLVGLLGAPGSGKTSQLLNILKENSKKGIPSMFFSMDMGMPLVYLKLIQKEFGITHEEAFRIYKHGTKEERKKIDDQIADTYKSVKFCFKAGLDVEEIRSSILEYQESTGRKVKFIGLDYLECIAGPYSDSTANTAIIANKLKDLANETEACVMLLLQTQKHAAQPDEPLISMKNIKGSSVIEQACSTILTMWREGYSPEYKGKDNYVSIATVKDRLNSLWSEDFHWTGLTGHIRTLTSEECGDLELFRKEKKDKKAQAASASGLNF